MNGPEDTTTAPTRRQLKRERAAGLRAAARGLGRRGRTTAGLAGAGVVVLLAATVTAGSLAAPVPPEVDGTAAPARLASVPAQGICPGPPRLPSGAEDGTDTEFSPVSTTAQSRLTAVLLSDLAGRFPGSTVRPLGGETAPAAQRLTVSKPQDIQQGEPATAGADGVPVRQAFVGLVDEPGGAAGEASVVAVEPMGGEDATADTVALYSAADGDLAGLDVTSCIAPGHEHWLTGATTTVGSTAVLVLSNPTSSASTVDLDLFGAEGPVEAPGTTGIVLAPGQTRSLVLGGMAPDEEHLAVHVSAHGGAVGATIQQHRLHGVTPGGVDIIQPTAAPARAAVMPGFVAPGPVEMGRITDQDGYEDVAPAVSIAAPAGTATAEVTVSGPDGPVALPDDGTVEIGAGATVRYPLPGLAPARYTVTVSADAPVVASAQGLSGRAGEALDISSVPAVETLGVERFTAVPTGATSSLVTYSEAGGAVEIVPVLADGSLGETTVQEIGRRSTRSVSIGALAGGEGAVGALVTTTEGQVHAGVSVRTRQGTSAYPVNPRTERTTDLPVRVGY